MSEGRIWQRGCGWKTDGEEGEEMTRKGKEGEATRKGRKEIEKKKGGWEHSQPVRINIQTDKTKRKG